MSISGNKGEWSEIYVLFHLLANGKLFAANEKLEPIYDMFFPIIKIIREEEQGISYDYQIDPDLKEVHIYLDGDKLATIPAEEFDSEAKVLFHSIVHEKTTSFSLPKTEAFMDSIYIRKLKAPAKDKSDISMKLHDVQTGFEKVVGFSIKSSLGSPPTLLNAGNTTNFIYKIEGLDPSFVDEVNSISSNRKVMDRIQRIKQLGGTLKYNRMVNKTFRSNLEMIDSQFPHALASILEDYFSSEGKNCVELVERITKKNPLKMTKHFYEYKMKELLCSIALGLRPATTWKGTDEATGGYIIATASGDVLTYHIYNRDLFKDYLYQNTYLDTPSSTRHGYGTIYEENGQLWIKLNLQIRFKN